MVYTAGPVENEFEATKTDYFKSSGRNFESHQVYNPQGSGCNDVLGELAVTG